MTCAPHHVLPPLHPLFTRTPKSPLAPGYKRTRHKADWPKRTNWFSRGLQRHPENRSPRLHSRLNPPTLFPPVLSQHPALCPRPHQSKCFHRLPPSLHQTPHSTAAGPRISPNNFLLQRDGVHLTDLTDIPQCKKKKNIWTLPKNEEDYIFLF